MKKFSIQTGDILAGQTAHLDKDMIYDTRGPDIWIGHINNDLFPIVDTVVKKLLPCPFCGSPAERHQTKPWSTGNKEHRSRHSIHCSGKVKCGTSPHTGGYLKRADAISAWNKRA
jgi:hypothetical protein